MRDAFIDADDKWLDARLRLVLADAVLVSSPEHPDHDALMLDNIEIGRRWRKAFKLNPASCTLIEFATDDRDLVEEARQWLEDRDGEAGLKAFSICWTSASLIFYVVARIHDREAATLFKVFFSGRDLDGWT